MRLIDADRLKGYLQDKYVMYDHTIEDIDAQPTVDAVPVVRCKDCEFGEPNGQYGCKCYHHKLYETHEMSPNDFCSKGKRKEDAETN